MKPALLLIPGMLNDASLWDEVAADLRGLAELRIAEPVQASIAGMAQAAWALLADLPPDRPVTVAGFSLGGYVAIEMLTHPVRKLRSAALLSTSARPETAEGAASREKTIAAMQRNFDKVITSLAQWNSHEPTPERLARITAMMRRVGLEVAVRQMRAIMARADHRAALARLDVPVTVLCGRQDRTTPPELAGEIAALIPGARCEIIDGAAHMLPIEQPGAVVRALLDSRLD
jgi:pimeloyl-ACP methyl ester carboxylesterase